MLPLLTFVFLLSHFVKNKEEIWVKRSELNTGAKGFLSMSSSPLCLPTGQSTSIFYTLPEVSF